MKLFNYFCMLAPPFLVQTHAFTRTLGTKGRVAALSRGVPHLQMVRCKTTLTNPTVSEVYQQLQQTFEANNIPEPEPSARYLVSAAAHVGMRYSDFALALNKPLKPKNVETLKEMELKRLQRVPIQYIVGHWDFCGVQLKVRPPVLIPRPETEELVSLVAEAHMPRPTAMRILDVGCGTGAIGIALLNRNRLASVVAIDVNEEAVELTKENVKAHQLSLRHTTTHANITDFKTRGKVRFDIIVSNPPYIPSAEVDMLEKELQYEDRGALDGGEDGLDVVKQILLASTRLLRPNGINEIWLEVSHTQPQIIAARAALGEFDTPTHSFLVKEWFRDMNHQPRFVRVAATPRLSEPGEDLDNKEPSR